MYQLYSDERQFTRDRDALIQKGLIDCVLTGKTRGAVNIYRYSSRWQKWTPGSTVDASVMSSSLLLALRQEKTIEHGNS